MLESLKGGHLKSRILALAVGPWVIPALALASVSPLWSQSAWSLRTLLAPFFEVPDLWPPRKT